MDTLNGLKGIPVVCGSKFDWKGITGWSNYRRLEPGFEPGYVGYTDDVGFYVKSHRTGITKLFIYDCSVLDEDGNYAGTKWVSPEGFRIEIELSSYLGL